MRILIVSRDLSAPPEAKHSEALQAVWDGHEISALSAAEFTADSLSDCEALVVTGSYQTDTPVPLEALSALTNIILDPELPVLGVGWGFQVVCLAYGDDLEETSEKMSGAPRIIPTSKGEALFQGSDPLRVSEQERWALDELPRGWAALASSDTGIEAFQHKLKPVYAIQQYPGDFTYPSDGKLVYQNLLGMLRYTKK